MTNYLAEALHRGSGGASLRARFEGTTDDGRGFNFKLTFRGLAGTVDAQELLEHAAQVLRVEHGLNADTLRLVGAYEVG